MNRCFAVLLLSILLYTPAALAMSEGCSGDCKKCHTLTMQEAGKLLKDVGEVKEIKMAPVNGLWEVTLERDGNRGVAYMDYGKKFILPGPIFPLTAEAAAKMGQQPVKQTPKPAKFDLSKIPLDHSLVMGNPKGKKKLIVFTDPECPFCAKLHGELKKLVAQEHDLVIYIKLFPLKMHPKAHDKARVILAEKSLELLDKSFAKEALPEPTAKHPAKPVDDIIALALSLGIDSTPTIIFQDGSYVEGSRDVAALKKLLDEKK